MPCGECKPDFKTAVRAWILAGGAHHTAYSYDVTTEMLDDFATIAGVELAVIDETTELSRFKQDLRTNESLLAPGQGLPGLTPELEAWRDVRLGRPVMKRRPDPLRDAFLQR